MQTQAKGSDDDQSLLDLSQHGRKNTSFTVDRVGRDRGPDFTENGVDSGGTRKRRGTRTAPFSDQWGVDCLRRKEARSVDGVCRR